MSKKSAETFSFDPTKAKAAFDRTEQRRNALSRESLDTVVVDLQQMAVIALGVAEFVHQDSVRKRFESLPESEWSSDSLKLLADCAWAAWHAHSEQLATSSSQNTAAVPLELIRDAYGIRERMLKVVDHNTDLQNEVASIREGSGHIDLTTDLSRLAKIYESHEDEIKHDRKHYRASDLATARQTAASILKHLAQGQSSQDVNWVEQKQRAYTLLRKAYSEVEAAGRFLFRHTNPDALFPNLIAAARKDTPRKTNDDQKPQ